MSGAQEIHCNCICCGVIGTDECGQLASRGILNPQRNFRLETTDQELRAGSEVEELNLSDGCSVPHFSCKHPVQQHVDLS